MNTGRADRWFRCLVVPLAMAVTALLLWATFRDVGIGVDELNYLQRTEGMAAYLDGSVRALARGDWQLPLSEPFILASFYRARNLPGHPDFFRLVNLPGWALARGTLTDIYANRLGNQAAFVLVFCPLFLLMVQQRAGAGAALFFYAALLANGRIFHELHMSTFDLPVMTMSFAALVAALAADRRRSGPLLAAVLLGCALNTKLQAAFLYGGFCALALLQRNRNNGRLLAAALLVAPAVYWLGRPWLWHDTWYKLAANAAYYQSWSAHTAVFGNFYRLPVWFLGELYVRSGDSGGAPFYYPLVLMWATLPVFVLALLPVGVHTLLQRRARGDIFILGALAAFFVMVMIPAAPKYDGARLYVTIYPLLYLLAAEGYARLRQRSAVMRRGWYRAGVLLLLALPVAGLLRLRPYYEAWYSDSVGGVAGAARLGLETQTTGACVNEAFITGVLGRLPAGTSVKLLPEIMPILQLYRAYGMLRPDLEIDTAARPQVAVVVSRQGFYSGWLQALLARDRPVLVEERDGVPLIRVYVDPRDRERLAACLVPAGRH